MDHVNDEIIVRCRDAGFCAELHYCAVDDVDLRAAFVVNVLKHGGSVLACEDCYVECAFNFFFDVEVSACSVSNCDSFSDHLVAEVMSVFVVVREFVLNVQESCLGVDNDVREELVPYEVERIAFMFAGSIVPIWVAPVPAWRTCPGAMVFPP